jgi:hypothetical protein
MRNTTIQNRSYQSFEFIVGPQISGKFGKFSTEVEYRQLLKITVRLVAHMQELLYNNSNSDFFSFALDRPTDYLFDYGYWEI